MKIQKLTTPQHSSLFFWHIHPSPPKASRSLLKPSSSIPLYEHSNGKRSAGCTSLAKAVRSYRLLSSVTFAGVRTPERTTTLIAVCSRTSRCTSIRLRARTRSTKIMQFLKNEIRATCRACWNGGQAGFGGGQGTAERGRPCSCPTS